MAIRFGLIGHGFMGHVHEKTLTSLPGAQLRAICDIAPEQLADIIRMVDEGKINQKTGKDLLKKVEATGKAPAAIVEAEGLGLIADSDALRKQIEAIIAASPEEVANFRAGKESLLGWFVGQLMRASGGKADPKRSREILLELLKKD